VPIAPPVHDVHLVRQRVPEDVKIVPEQVHLEDGLLHLGRFNGKALGLDHARLLERRLFAWAFETELDKQGRLLLPQNLREFAGLGTEAVVLGSMKHAEIWSPDRWDQYSRGLLDTDAFTQAIAGLGI
jgi:MraZ protein